MGVEHRAERYFICASTFKLFLKWCSENRMHQDDPRLVVVTGPDSMYRLRGYRWKKGDQRILLGDALNPLPNSLWFVFDTELSLMGCPEA